MPTADISRAAFGIMTAAPAERPATYQDVLDTPAHRVAEVRASPLHMQPRPASHHAWARSGPNQSPFHAGDGGPDEWWIINKPELHLGADIVGPDRHPRLIST